MKTEELMSLCLAWQEVGSRVTCDPPVMDTDRDILCLVSDQIEFVAVLSVEGFGLGGSGHGRAQSERLFSSMRRDSDNLIITDDPGFYEKFRLATGIAKYLNVLEKPDRVALFQAVLYGKEPVRNDT